MTKTLMLVRITSEIQNLLIKIKMGLVSFFFNLLVVCPVLLIAVGTIFNDPQSL